MTNLLVESDLTARLGRSLTSTEQTRAAAYMTDVSALIRGYCRQTFTAVSGDVVELRPVGTRIRLIELPVTAVTTVVAIGWGGQADVTLPAGSWGFDGIDTIEITPFSSDTWLSLPDVDVHGYPDTYRITYSHGDATVPADVVAVAAGAVLRVLTAPSQVEGMSSERIGQYSYQMSQQVNGGSAGLSVKLTETDKDALSRYRRKATTVQLVL